MPRVLDVSTSGLTAAQRETAKFVEQGFRTDVSYLAIWRESETVLMGVEIVADGAHNIAFYDENGELSGDWIR